MLEGLPRVRKAATDTPVTFYVRMLRRDADRPAGSVGITNDPGELLRPVLDVLERKRM